MKIFKYPLTDQRFNIVELPTGAIVLSVAKQSTNQLEVICIWALVDENERVFEQRKFYTFMTGEQLPEEGGTPTFIGTVHLFGGSIVAHVFEEDQPG